jgi:hypothetical protein
MKTAKGLAVLPSLLVPADEVMGEGLMSGYWQTLKPSASRMPASGWKSGC